MLGDHVTPSTPLPTIKKKKKCSAATASAPFVSYKELFSIFRSFSRSPPSPPTCMTSHGVPSPCCTCPDAHLALFPAVPCPHPSLLRADLQAGSRAPGAPHLNRGAHPGRGCPCTCVCASCGASEMPTCCVAVCCYLSCCVVLLFSHRYAKAKHKIKLHLF